MTTSAGHEARTGIRSAAPGGGAITRRIAGDDEMAVGSGGSGGSGGSVSDAGGGEGGSGSAAGPSQAGGAGGAAMYVAVMSSQLVRLANRPSASRFRSESQSAESAALGVGRDGGGSSSRTSSPQSASSNMS